MNVRSVVLRARKVRLFIREKFNIPIDTKDKRSNEKYKKLFWRIY